MRTKLILDSRIELDVTDGLTEEALASAVATLKQTMRDAMPGGSCNSGSHTCTEMVVCRCYREVQNTEITHYNFDVAYAALDRMRA